jgi:uncharacterized protein with PQ loop repeat
MSIQDIVITIASIIISLSLIPQVILGFKTKTGAVSYWTSIPYALSLSAVGLSFASLELWLSTIVTAITVILWSILAIQKYIYSSK